MQRHAGSCIGRTGVRGTSRQGKEAGASLDPVGPLSTSDQKDIPISVQAASPLLGLGLPWTLNSAFSPGALLNHFKYWSSCEWPQANQLLL